MGKIELSKTARKLYFANYLPVGIGYFLISTIALGRILTSNILAVALSILITSLSLIVISPKIISNRGGKSNSHTAGWTWAISILTSLYSVHHLLSNSNFILTSFPQRTIGIVVLEGLDLAFRSNLYPILILVFILIFFLSYWAYYNLDTFIALKLTDKYISNERRALFSLSLASIFILIFHYLNGADVIVNIFDIFLFLILLNLIMLLIKIYALNKKVLLLKLLNRYDFIILSLLSPLVVFFLRWILINGSFIFTYNYFGAFAVLWLSFWFSAYHFVKVCPKGKSDRVTSRVLLAAIPYLLIPISIPLSNELQFSFSGISNISARSVSFITLGALLATSFLLFFISAKRRAPLKFHFASNFYLPIFIATLVFFNIHTNFIEIPSGFDMFHHGENLLSTQQLFSFKNIPFVDIYPTHGISYMVGQALYSLINGYRAFEPWLWEWVTKIFEVLLFYFVLKKISNSFFATIVISFLPILGIFGGHHFTYGFNKSLVTTYYFASFLGALSMTLIVKRPTYKKLLIHWLICFFLLTWRVDFGFAAFTSSLFILLSISLKEWFYKIKTDLKTSEILKSFFFASLIAVTLGVLLSFIGGESFLKNIFQVSQFIKIQALAQGLPTISGSISPISIFQYFVLPGIAVFYIIFFIFFLFRKGSLSFGSVRLMLLFLAIFSLIMSVRSVQRQTLAVLGYNSYLFVFLGICIPFYIKNLSTKTAMTIFILFLLAYQFILPDARIVARGGRLVNLISWKAKESRVKVNDYQYRELVSFLNSNLKANQTFLDLTSSPLLYVASNKKFVSYFIPSAYHTSEPIQLHTLERIQRAFASDEIPIVIFRQPDPYANSIDGVPNEIRSYRIYEFIYKNYKPLGSVNGYTIWIAYGHKPTDTQGLIPITSIDQNFDLKKLPYIWGTFDEMEAINNTLILSSLLNYPRKLNPGETVKLGLDNKIDKSSGNYLHLKIRSDSPGTLRLIYGKNPFSSVNMDLLGSGKMEDYLIRISSQWVWITQNLNSLELTSTKEAVVINAFIRKGD